MTNDERWSACPEGTMQQLKKSLDTAERRRTMTRRAALTAVMLGGAGLGALAFRSSDGPPGGITCDLVHSHAADYVRGVTESVLTRQIDAHRAECRKCDTVLRSLEA
ncbi:MAG: hypothetical protein R3C19_11990 [Planctomycetaceae bacterium]